MQGLFFDVIPKPGHMAHYFEHVDRLKPVLARHDGLLYLERFRPLDGPEALLSHQIWRDAEAMAAWRADPSHRVSQSAGRHRHFETYRIRVGDEIDAVPDRAGRFLIAAYGPVLWEGGRGYESVTEPGRFLSLQSVAAGAALTEAKAAAQRAGVSEIRLFELQRDYSMTDRAEAPST